MDTFFILQLPLAQVLPVYQFLVILNFSYKKSPQCGLFLLVECNLTLDTKNYSSSTELRYILKNKKGKKPTVKTKKLTPSISPAPIK